MCKEMHSIIVITHFQVQTRGWVVVSQEIGANKPVISYNLITA